MAQLRASGNSQNEAKRLRELGSDPLGLPSLKSAPPVRVDLGCRKEKSFENVYKLLRLD